MKLEANGSLPIRALVLILACAEVSLCQSPMAQIAGRVTDPSGGLVPGAHITAVNVDTSVQRATDSNDQGYYAIPLLPPGNYRVTASKTGFRPLERSGISLHVADDARIDFQLPVSEIQEAISVQADASMLDTNEGSLGTVVDNRKIISLPLNGRNTFDLVLLAPGTTPYGRPALPGNNIPLSNFSTNGGPPETNEILLDGVPNTAATRQNEALITPSIDAVQEFKMETNSIKAEFGRTGGSVVNVSLKSGTNAFHGTLFEFFRNDKLDANNWFNNRSGQQRPPFRFNQFGATLGGPVIKNKTFFFVNYEGLRRIRGETFLFTVPRADMRAGDFSQVKTAAGQPIQIFDPLTTRPNPGGSGVIRSMFPGNVIPLSRMDPVSLKMLTYWAPPNLPGDPRTGSNNFISTAGETFSVNQFNTRIDQTIGSRHQLYGRFSGDGHPVTPPNVFGNVGSPSSGPQNISNRNTGIGDTWTVTPQTIMTFRAGYARLHDYGIPFGGEFDATKLGLPASFVSAEAYKQFPQVTVSGMSIANIGFGTSSLGSVAGSRISNVYPNMYTAQSDITLVRGKHIWKFGADARVFRHDGYQLSGPGGVFSFTPGFTQGPDPSLGSPSSGHAFAGFLLGTPASGSLTSIPSKDEQNYYLGFFAQDDWKLTPALTLNLGLRLDGDTCLTERRNELTFADFKSLSPVQAATTGPQLTGGVGFVGVNGKPRTQCDASRNNWGPRFGFAYSANSKTVVRGGYGLMYVPLVRAGMNSSLGFTAVTQFVPSLDGFTPVNFLSNPFPNGSSPASGSSLGLSTNLGQGMSSPDRLQRSPYVEQWNFTLQRTLPGSVLVEVAYAGSRGVHLDGDIEWNQMPDQFLALGNSLLQRVSNPFLGQIPSNTSLGAGTIAAAQLLRRFPQFTSFTTVRSKFGSSIYHSMQLRSERRMSSGLTFLLAYTGGKLIDDGSPGILNFVGPVPGYQDNNNRRLERSISSQEVSQRLVISFVYELPFGPGKSYLASGLLGRVVGGWQVNGITTFQTGIPLALTAATNPTLGQVGSGNLRPNNNGKSAKLSGPVSERLNEYFDTSVFSQPAPWIFGTTARTLPDVRAPGTVNFDLAMFKNTRIREQYLVQFRTEFFNAMNHANFGPPGQVFGAPNFGVITSAAAARNIQFGLKLYF